MPVMQGNDEQCAEGAEHARYRKPVGAALAGGRPRGQSRSYSKIATDYFIALQYFESGADKFAPGQAQTGSHSHSSSKAFG